MRAILRPTIVIFLGLTLVTGLAYPLLVTALAQTLFYHQASGSLIVHDGAVIGSELVGQPFDSPRYFWGRLSATAGGAYNPLASGGSNLGPTNARLTQAAEQRLAHLRRADPQAPGPVPADLVTASASGLDPHITPQAAAYQVPRVARARHLDESAVSKCVARCTEPRQLGFLGEPRVNVLRLNSLLDGLQ